MNDQGDCCGPTCAPLPPGEAQPFSAEETDLADLAKALGHPARVRILRLLIERNTCVCGDIVDHLPLAQSTVSQHLKQLKDAGLIQGDIDGPRICYGVNRSMLKRLQVLMAGL